MGLTAGGIGSGLPVDDLISKLMSVEAQPLKQLDTQEASFLSKVSALGSLKGAVSAFQTATKALQDAGQFLSIKKASLSNTDYASVSASSKASAGSYSLFVTDVAQSQKLATAAFSSPTSIIGGGTLTFTFGTTSGASFTANPDKTPKTVTIGANATLNDIRDAVNNANIGVSASIINDGSGYKLTFSSADTGTKNTLKIETADSALQAFRNIPGGATLTETQAAKDAQFTLDGIAITKQSNTITDVVDGLTITLKKKQAVGDPNLSLSVSKDTGGAVKAVESFIKAFNDLNKTLNDLSAVDPATPKRGTARKSAPLAGETIIRSVRNQIRSAFNSAQAVDGAYKSAGELGIAFQRDGTLKLDSTKLQAALDSKASDVAKFFGAVGTPSDSNVLFNAATSSTKAGTYALNITALQNGVLRGTDVGSSVTLGAPQSYSVTIDGTASGSLTIPAGTYTPAELASNIQTAINADATLVAASAKVAITVDSSNRLQITSLKTGTSSTVAVVSGLSVAGFTDGSSGTAGAANVTGTIDGRDGTGVGNILTGPAGTNVSGLALEIKGGYVGDRGTVKVTRGFAYALDSVLDSLLDSKKGAIQAQTDGINTSVKDIGNRREILNRRLADTELRYRKQFTALDTLVAQFNTLQSSLAQGLASLPKL
jgi:flagellar hook-associated protein 2